MKLELTRLAADTTQEADPTAFRVINCCCTWGEYVAEGRSYFGVLPQPIQNGARFIRPDACGSGMIRLSRAAHRLCEAAWNQRKSLI